MSMAFTTDRHGNIRMAIPKSIQSITHQTGIIEETTHTHKTRITATTSSITQRFQTASTRLETLTVDGPKAAKKKNIRPEAGTIKKKTYTQEVKITVPSLTTSISHGFHTSLSAETTFPSSTTSICHGFHTSISAKPRFKALTIDGNKSVSKVSNSKSVKSIKSKAGTVKKTTCTHVDKMAATSFSQELQTKTFKTKAINKTVRNNRKTTNTRGCCQCKYH